MTYELYRLEAKTSRGGSPMKRALYVAFSLTLGIVLIDFFVLVLGVTGQTTLTGQSPIEIGGMMFLSLLLLGVLLKVLRKEK